MTTTWTLETASPPAWLVDRVIAHANFSWSFVFSAHGRFVETWVGGYEWDVPA